MISQLFPRRNWLLWFAAGLALAFLLDDSAPAAASMPYVPLFEFTSISSSAPGANANVTFTTSLPAGHHLIGAYGLETADNSWAIASHSSQLNGKVAAVGTMTVNLEPDGNCNDGDSGAPQTYGPFPLLDQDPGSGGPHAIWSGTITDFADGNPGTSWGLSFTIEPLDTAYTIDGFLTDAILPAGKTVCTPQTFILTMCGRANPIATATTCGSGSNPIVMTNPPAAGCYLWRFVSLDESGQHSATPQAGVSIGGTPCDADADGVPDPSDNCPLWPNAGQNLPPWLVPANDPDCDGFSSTVETAAGTYRVLHCGFEAWPADINNDRYSDIFDISELTANFGVSVPPAPARHNISPDPPDGFVDIFDVSEMTAFFGLSCAPCPGDLDCDSTPDVADNCPNWSNPTQVFPPWPIPPNDPDCDGFSTAVETAAGTAPLTHCGPDAWPADINNDTYSDIFDISEITANFGVSVPPAPARHNISPDPPDGFVDIFDISEITAFFPLRCL